MQHFKCYKPICLWVLMLSELILSASDYVKTLAGILIEKIFLFIRIALLPISSLNS